MMLIPDGQNTTGILLELTGERDWNSGARPRPGPIWACTRGGEAMASDEGHTPDCAVFRAQGRRELAGVVPAVLMMATAALPQLRTSTAGGRGVKRA